MSALHSFSIYLSLCALLMASCQTTPVYEKNITLTDHVWRSGQVLTGEVQISDTAALYDVYLVLRHKDSYRYNNIWVDGVVVSPKDSFLFRQTNLTLGNDQTGWEGSGMDDIWDVRKKINTLPVHFSHIGQYQFKLRHIMRDDPLKSIMSAGIRIERIVP